MGSALFFGSSAVVAVAAVAVAAVAAAAVAVCSLVPGEEGGVLSVLRRRPRPLVPVKVMEMHINYLRNESKWCNMK